MMDLETWAKSIRSDAQKADHRRLIVIHGTAPETRALTERILDEARFRDENPLIIGQSPFPNTAADHLPHEKARNILGTTHPIIVYDTHERLDPDTLGAATGATDGGGLLILLTPKLDDWPHVPDEHDEMLTVPPYTVGDVTGRFKKRLIRTLEDHDGVAILNADTQTLEDPGHAPSSHPVETTKPLSVPDAPRFPSKAYEACLTHDQITALDALESLVEGSVVVLEADRGRGKSSALGLAAACLAKEGDGVLVSAPRFGNAREVFDRARECFGAWGETSKEVARGRLSVGEGWVRFVTPAEALEFLDDDEEVDALLVDEAAGIPVHVLNGFLEAGVPVAFASTVHGYEGAGRGFSVRFKDALEASDREVVGCVLEDPIRYARGDPVEAWARDALLLDAAPAPEDEVRGADVGSVMFEALGGASLLEDEGVLREAFGLLVFAHYRTSPRDLSRVLDAPNLSVRALMHEGHVVAVALLAGEGGWSRERCSRVYEGGEVRGHLIPDVLTSQLRDEEAGLARGVRVVRIAVHPALRRRGLGSSLLDGVREEASGAGVGWVGASFGATPGLVGFWAKSGFEAVHVGTSRNASSGEHSVVMMQGISGEGRELVERSSAWLVERFPSVLGDALSGLDVDVVRAVLSAVEGEVGASLSDRAWRHVVSCVRGVGVYDANPSPFRVLGFKALVEGGVGLSVEGERLVVAKVLEAWSWGDVVEDVGIVSERVAKLSLMSAFELIVEAFAPGWVLEEKGRFGG